MLKLQRYWVVRETVSKNLQVVVTPYSIPKSVMVEDYPQGVEGPYSRPDEAIEKKRAMVANEV